MTTRGNSLRTVLVDGGILLVAGFLALATVSIVMSQEVNELRPDPRTTDDAIDSRQNTDDNLPSGDPTEGPTARNETKVLGMTLKSGGTGRAIVTDVGATSPAWDAGIRRGDLIVELAGTRPANFAKWSEEIRDILHDTQDGHAVPVKVHRGGDQLALRVKLPESRAAEVRDARQEEEAIAREQVRQRRTQQGQHQDRIVEYGRGYGGGHPGFGPGYGGGVGVFAGDDEVDSDSSPNSGVATRAAADLFAVNRLSGSGGGGRVGQAMFENSDNGVTALVEVGGLPQGAYRVGITDGSRTGGIDGAGFDDSLDSAGDAGLDSQRTDGSGIDQGNLNPKNFNEQQQRQRQEQQGGGSGLTTPPRDGSAPGTGVVPPTVPPTGVAPTPDGAGGTGGVAPQGGAGSGSDTFGSPATGQSGSLASPSNAILAQQIGQQGAASTNAGSGTDSAATPPAGRTAPGGQTANPNVANQPINRGQHSGSPNQNNMPANTGGFGIGSPDFLAEIGMLNIGPGGTGRVENQLQGLTVQNLSGMAVAVVPARSEANTGVGGVGGPNNTVDQNSGVNRRTPRDSTDGNVGVNNGGQGPVAIGMIRLLEGRGFPRQPSNDPDDVRQRGEQEAAERQRDEARQREFSPTPPEEMFDSSEGLNH